jgi:DNA-binding CsgD family transcriptional regulator
MEQVRGITKKVNKKHCQNIYKKLDVKNRTQAGVKFFYLN